LLRNVWGLNAGVRLRARADLPLEGWNKLYAKDGDGECSNLLIN
jgi:hypothetical protein